MYVVCDWVKGNVGNMYFGDCDEIFDSFDIVDPTGGSTNSSAAPAIFKRSMKTVKT